MLIKVCLSLAFYSVLSLLPLCALLTGPSLAFFACILAAVER